MNARQRIEKAVARNGLHIALDADGVPWLTYLPGDGWLLVVDPAPIMGNFHHCGVFQGGSANEVISELDYFGGGE